MTTTAKAQANLNDLDRKHDDAVKQLASLERERDRIAFDAHTSGGDARKRLTAVLAQHGALAGEIASLEAAIEEASRRIEAAESDAVNAEQRRKALEVRGLLDAVHASAKAIDEAAAQIVAATKTFSATMLEIDRLGFGPNPHLVKLNLVRALEAALVGSPLELSPVAPGNRTTVESLAAGWAVQVKNRTAALLHDESKALATG